MILQFQIKTKAYNEIKEILPDRAETLKQELQIINKILLQYGVDVIQKDSDLNTILMKYQILTAKQGIDNYENTSGYEFDPIPDTPIINEEQIATFIDNRYPQRQSVPIPYQNIGKSTQSQIIKEMLRLKQMQVQQQSQQQEVINQIQQDIAGIKMDTGMLDFILEAIQQTNLAEESLEELEEFKNELEQQLIKQSTKYIEEKKNEPEQQLIKQSTKDEEQKNEPKTKIQKIPFIQIQKQFQSMIENAKDEKDINYIKNTIRQKGEQLFEQAKNSRRSNQLLKVIAQNTQKQQQELTLQDVLTFVENIEPDFRLDGGNLQTLCNTIIQLTNQLYLKSEEIKQSK